MDAIVARTRTPARRRIAALAVVLLSTIVLATCDSPTNASKSQAATGKRQPVRYVVKEFKRSAFGCGPDGRKECAWVEVTYPMITSAHGKLKSVVNASVVEEIFGKGPRPKDDRMISRWLANGAASLARDRRKCRECNSPWFDQSRVEVETNMPFAFTISMKRAWYHGTDHPYELTGFVNYHPVTAREIRLPDMLKLGGILQLEKIAERLFRKRKELSPQASLREAGFFYDSDRFHLSENFALYDTELMLYYNLYEIATYADGITVITIPYRDIRHLLRPELGILPYAR